MNSQHSDELVTQVLNFFEDQTYTDDIVDLLVKVTCDALKVNINIYQNNDGLVQCIPVKIQPPAKTIYLKFTQTMRLH